MTYEQRMLIPLQATEEFAGTEFKTRSGLIIARGYLRVVIGERGPYLEFDDTQILKDNAYIPEDQKWRKRGQYSYVYYDEYRTIDACFVKLYKQRRVVDYADYRVGLWYISPFELHTDSIPLLVAQLPENKPSSQWKMDQGDIFEGE